MAPDKKALPYGLLKWGTLACVSAQARGVRSSVDFGQNGPATGGETGLRASGLQGQKTSPKGLLAVRFCPNLRW
jgi:hypothetical protein